MTTPPARSLPSGTAAGENGIVVTGGHVRLQFSSLIDEEPNHLELDPSRLTGQTWILLFHCKGAPTDKEFIELEIDRADINFYNLLFLKSKFGFAGRDFLYYKKRCGGDKANLTAVDYDTEAIEMIQNNIKEKKVRMLLSRDQPTQLQVNITPIKRPRVLEPCTDDPIDAYKVWLAELQRKAKEKHDDDGDDDDDDDDEEEGKQREPEFKDDYRDETIMTYKEWLRQRRQLYNIMSYVQEDTNGAHSHPEDENQESSPSAREWPSHARLPKKKGKGVKRNGRGTLKGISVVIKRVKSGTQKLDIEFSETRGGPIGPNARDFVNEVVDFTRKRAPVIGVRSWKDIKQNVKDSIVTDILNKWAFKNTKDAKEKILDIASERYRGWRSTFSATYKAYNNYDERMKKKPDDLDIIEWHYLVLYFGTEKFQNVSQKNSGNRKQQKTKHLMGSKPYSQYSYELRDPETGEEPSDLKLFQITHMKKTGEWSNAASKSIYDDATMNICKRELMSPELILTTVEENSVFQSTYKESTRCKTSKQHVHGYLAKYPTRRQLMDAQIEEQARVASEAQQKNIELEAKVQKLQEQLAYEAAERDRILEENRRQIREEEQQARDAFKKQITEELRQEMCAIREEMSQQVNPENNIPKEISNVRKTGTSNVKQNNNVNVSASFISLNQLKAHTRGRARTRSESDDII